MTPLTRRTDRKDELSHATFSVPVASEKQRIATRRRPFTGSDNVPLASVHFGSCVEQFEKLSFTVM